MKYKRQLMGSLVAVAILVGGYPGVDVKDFVPKSKVGQYLSQVHMKSVVNEGDSRVESKKK
jgi:hypothetical protein